MKGNAGLITLAVTTGEPAGIGPEIAVSAAHACSHLPEFADVRIVLLGDARLLAERARAFSISTPLLPYRGLSAGSPGVSGSAIPVGMPEVLDCPLEVECVAGRTDARNAPALLRMLDRAIDGALAGEFAALVTAPLQKSTLNEAGIAFTGHTEYLAQRTETPRVVMMLVGGSLRVALATTHLPLRDVPDALSRDLLEEVLRVLHGGLRQQYGIAAPRILVAGLNPHAGEGGYLGREEIDIITPVIEKLRSSGLDIKGPYPADTLFQPKYLKDCDAVLAMYHDQGLPVLKFASFGQGINVTLGLPIIRTSVDHGTALDIAGTGQADVGSMIAALQAARSMAQSVARSSAQSVSGYTTGSTARHPVSPASPH